MNKENKRHLIELLIVLCLVIFSSSAFLVRDLNISNIITFGNIKVNLINHTVDENGKEVKVTNEKELLKKSDVSRIIKVKNVCKNPAFVRIKLVLSGTEKDKKTSYDVSHYMTCKTPHSKWKKKGEWFYYTEVLEPNMTSEDLIDSVHFDLDQLGSYHAGSTLTLNVKLQAVQSEHNSKSALTAKGWPKEVNV